MRRIVLFLIASSALGLIGLALYARFVHSPAKAPLQEASLPGCKEMNRGERRRKKGEALVLAKLPGTYRVRCVVDGDTFEIEFESNGETRRDKVRALGFNSPETVDRRAGKGIQCFGTEASRYAKRLLTGAQVRLEGDPTQYERDNFQRLIAYVYLPTGELYNLRMIKEGYGHEYTYSAPYRKQAEFRSAEREAKQAKRGMWRDDSCALASSQKKRPT